MSQKTKYSVICADPCWDFSDQLKMSDVKRGAKSQYNTLSFEEIKNLKVCDLAADDAVLALWTPSSLLPEGLETMKSWGFEFKQTLPWVKLNKNYHNILYKLIKNFSIKEDKLLILNEFKKMSFDNLLSFGMGRLFRQSHEIVLLGTKGKIYSKLKNKSQRSVIFDINYRHSQKPESLQDKLQMMFPSSDNKYLELFARRVRPGWTCLGNEVCSGEDIRESIKKLL